MTTDKILHSRTFRVVASPLFAIVVQTFSFYLLYKLAGSVKFALVMWFGTRIFALWVNMIQNYWTHTREFGYRRYHHDGDNAMNIGEWLRLSHEESEYDFGFLTVKVMKALGLVKATTRGETIPEDVPLGALGF